MASEQAQPVAGAARVSAKAPANPSLRAQSRPGETIIGYILLACGAVSVLTTVGIVIVLLSQTILFFQSRAWIGVRLPVAQEAPLATVSGSVNETDGQISIVYLDETRVFQQGQLIQVDEEIMLVTDRTRSRLFVQRGQEGTVPLAHAADTQIFPMVPTAVRTVDDMENDDLTVTVTEGFGRGFTLGQDIKIGAEVLRVIDIDGDVLSVERGIEGSIVPHSANSAVEAEDRPTLTEFFSNTVWQPVSGQFGILPLVTATMLTSLVAMTVSIPIGMGIAIYLAEYASPRVRGTMKPILEILAGVPTVVYGFFALTFITPGLRTLFFGDAINFTNMLAAGLAMGILITPLISSMCEDAISAVPRALREASYGLGATKLETTIQVVLPAAVSGISAAIIIGLSRAVGETMIVALASGAGPNFTFNLLSSAETMTGHIVRISGGDLSYGTIDYVSIFAVGATLFVITFTLNVLSGYIANRLRERY
ncbi:MAG: phosphate ABC transporter permease subunit PstC [Anaerolineae bacterium]|nr:phosphate ABC transporter permease subunit PstC [Anaerolineae bacterium]